jgi:signal transduction histidine kinase
LRATPANTSAASKTVTPGELMVSVARLPGWRVRMPMPGGKLPAGVTSRQAASYLWVGSLTIALMATLAVLAGRALRRQMRVTRLKTDLVAAVSHELKTPLASMQLLVDSLLETEPLDPVRTREYLQLVARENTRLNRLIENFLTFSRMENARGKFEFARARPEDVVHSALESVAGRFPVQVEIEPGLPALHADVDALVTVLLNLLDNAFKYTGDDKHIELRAYTTHDRLCFEVRDNGIGIAPRDQKRVFRRFFQVDRALSRQTGGVGLGLSIVEFIVKAHGGTVSVFSQAGIGSRFTVSLPFVVESKEVAV